MEHEKKRDIKFQIELLKIQLDMDYKLIWFFAIFGVLVSVATLPLDSLDFLRWVISPILVGLTMIFIALESDWKKKTLSELEKKYLD